MQLIKTDYADHTDGTIVLKTLNTSSTLVLELSALTNQQSNWIIPSYSSQTSRTQSAGDGLMGNHGSCAPRSLYKDTLRRRCGSLGEDVVQDEPWGWFSEVMTEGKGLPEKEKKEKEKKRPSINNMRRPVLHRGSPESALMQAGIGLNIIILHT